MYTALSAHVPDNLRQKIIFHTQRIRPIFRIHNQNSTEITFGSRFSSDEQVFQAFCQNISHEDEISHIEKYTIEMLVPLIESALKSAGRTDRLCEERAYYEAKYY